MKENEETKIVEFSEKEFEFLRGALIDQCETVLAFFKEQAKRFFKAEKERNEDKKKEVKEEKENVKESIEKTEEN